MAQGRAGCNRLVSEEERVFDHLDATRRIDKRHVEARFGILPGRFPRKEFGRRAVKARDLARAKRHGRAIAGRGCLDLDEDHAGTVAEDQVDFPGLAAPAPGRDRGARVAVAARHPIFGRLPRQIGPLPLQPSRGSLSAAW